MKKTKPLILFVMFLEVRFYRILMLWTMGGHTQDTNNSKSRVYWNKSQKGSAGGQQSPRPRRWQVNKWSWWWHVSTGPLRVEQRSGDEWVNNHRICRLQIAELDGKQVWVISQERGVIFMPRQGKQENTGHDCNTLTSRNHSKVQSDVRMSSWYFIKIFSHSCCMFSYIFSSILAEARAIQINLQ